MPVYLDYHATTPVAVSYTHLDVYKRQTESLSTVRKGFKLDSKVPFAGAGH